MAKGLVDEQYLTDIADAIRTKNGTETQYKPSEMASAISSISTKVRPDYVSFYRYKGASLDISWLDTSNITNMGYMFSSCSNLTTLGVSEWNTSNVTDMGSMFYGCSNLTTLDIGNWNTSNVTSMGSMFQSCSSLTILDVSKWDTSNVTTINGMFQGCSNLTTLDVSKWDTSNVTDMDWMFYGCRLLATIDMSSMNAPTEQGEMTFRGCGENLETPTIVYVKDEAMQQWVLNTTGVPENWSTSNVIIKA